MKINILIDFLRSSSSNSRPPSRADNNNQVSSTTGSGSMLLNNNNNNTNPRVYSRETRNQQQNTQSNTPPLVLSLSQIQGGGGLLILNSNSSNNTQHQNVVTPVSVANFVSNRSLKNDNGRHLVLKQEVMDTNQSCCHPGNNTKETKIREAKIEINENLRQSAFDGGYNRHQTEVVMSSAPSTPSKHMDTGHDDVVDEYKQGNFCGKSFLYPRIFV